LVPIKVDALTYLNELMNYFAKPRGNNGDYGG